MTDEARGPLWDVLVVGGGSTGLSAALMLGRARRRVLVVDARSPRNASAPHVHGLLTRDGYPPLQLLADGRREVEGYGVEVREGRAASAHRERDRIVVVCDDGERHAARRLLVATGARDELPAIAGLEQQWGRGAVVCPYCDGHEVRDGRIGVLATSAASTHQAQMLRQWSPRVTYLTNAQHAPGPEERRAMQARGIVVDERPVSRVVSTDGRLVGVQTDDGETLPLDALFVTPVSVPLDTLLVDLGAERVEDHGVAWVETSSTGRTSVAGVWAAGNVVKASGSVPVVIGAGALAGGAINSDLLDEDIEAAVAELDARTAPPTASPPAPADSRGFSRSRPG